MTATAARRTAVAAAGKTVHSGRVAGLTLEGRRVGDVTEEPRLPALRRLERRRQPRQNRAHADPRQRPRLATQGNEDPRRHRDRPRRGRRHRHPPPPRRHPPRPPRPSRRRRRPSASAPPRSPKRLTGQGYTFPVYGKATAADDFGAARADTGVHEGNDVFAPFGAPVLAVADGTVSPRRHAAHRRQPPCGSTPTPATRSSTRTSPPSPPTPSTAAASRPAPSSASPATPATPSRPRRTSTSRSTPAARPRTRSIRMRSCSHGRSTATWPRAPG